MLKDLLGREFRVGQEIIYLYVMDLKIEELYGTITDVDKEWVKAELNDGYDTFVWKIIDLNRVNNDVEIIITKDVLSPSIDNVMLNRFDLLDL